MGTNDAVSGDPYQTGQEAILKIGGQEFAITNVSYTKDVDTNEVQMNDSLTPRIAVTGLTFSGSFEHSGHNTELRKATEYTKAEVGDGTGRQVHEAMEPKRGTITINEHKSDGTMRSTTFEGVLVTSRSKDIPSDDSTSVTYDWVAESMSIVE